MTICYVDCFDAEYYEIWKEEKKIKVDESVTSPVGVIRYHYGINDGFWLVCYSLPLAHLSCLR